MRKLRRSFREHVMSEIAWTETPQRRTATEWKEHMIEILMARGPDFAARGELLRLCLPGDSRHSECVDFCFWAHLKRFNGERLLKLSIASGVIPSVCGHRNKKYPRYRWTGFDLSISELGILEAAHQMLSTAFRMFCELHGSTNTALSSTRPELGAAEHVPWLPILDAESFAAQGELQEVLDEQAAQEGSSNFGASADEDWPRLRPSSGELQWVAAPSIRLSEWPSSRRSLSLLHESDKWERKQRSRLRGPRSGESTAWKWRLRASLRRDS